MNEVIVYGAYGYTGKLIVDELIKVGIQPTIAGRSKEKSRLMASELKLEYSSFELSDKEALIKSLKDHKVLIHCAGPFIHTANQMAEACIETNTHYLDITGEFQVFEALQQYNDRAEKANIMLLPGAGFDVVPSDCLAAKLKKLMPDAKHLKLAFTSVGGGLSRGTTKTMIENLDKGHALRVNGDLSFRRSGNAVRYIDFGKFEQLSMGISWGDISTAFYSTQIPNIEVYIGTTKKQLRQVRVMSGFSFLFRIKSLKNLLLRNVDKKPPGPSETRRAKSNMYLWGRVENEAGEFEEQRLVTPNGYSLTAATATLITSKILQGNFKTGFQTPSTAYGTDLILEVAGTEFY